jgi:GDP-L-fucose synthase
MAQPREALTAVCRPAPADPDAGDAPNLRPETLLLNVGSGEDHTIRGLADIVKDVVGFQGEIVWDAARPDGTPRKLLDVSRLQSLGWRPAIALREGIAATYRAYLED